MGGREDDLLPKRYAIEDEGKAPAFDALVYKESQRQDGLKRQ